MMDWRKHVEPMLSAEEIASVVKRLGAEITTAYEGKAPIMVCILKGSSMFFTDLCRNIDLPVRFEFMGISSYGDDTESSGVVEITQDLGCSIRNEDVIIVEDIIDTGLTMRYLLDNFATRKPASLQVCSLLHKPSNARVEVPIDYKGFTIPDEFVVGYGLDLAGRFRNLPSIGIYKGEI